MLKVATAFGVVLSLVGVALRVLTPTFSDAHGAALPLVILGGASAAAAALALAVRARRPVMVVSATLAVLTMAGAVGYYRWSIASGDAYADIGGIGIIAVAYLLSMALSSLTAWCAPPSRVPAPVCDVELVTGGVLTLTTRRKSRPSGRGISVQACSR